MEETLAEDLDGMVNTHQKSQVIVINVTGKYGHWQLGLDSLNKRLPLYSEMHRVNLMQIQRLMRAVDVLVSVMGFGNGRIVQELALDVFI